MPKFTFICEDEPMPFSEGVITKRTVEFDAVFIDDVVSEFELFLRGAGFVYDGALSIEEPVEQPKQTTPNVPEQTYSFVNNNGETSSITIFGGTQPTMAGDSTSTKCYLCGLTKEQLGIHNCYDANCPSKTIFTVAR
jgi:hypothetical protein